MQLPFFDGYILIWVTNSHEYTWITNPMFIDGWILNNVNRKLLAWTLKTGERAPVILISIIIHSYLKYMMWSRWNPDF